MLFVSSEELFSFLRCLNCCPRLNKKAKVNFKIYDITNWITNNYNKQVARYLIKKMELVNDIWSDKRI